MKDGLVERVYAEEVADGATRRQAARVATSVLVSPAYRAAWLAGRAERLREREEREEIAEQMVKDAENYTGNPEEWEVRGY